MQGKIRPHSLCPKISRGKLNGWKQQETMKCRNLHVVQNSPKSNTDRAHHVAQCLTGSWHLLGVFASHSKTNDAAYSVIWLLCSSICFLKCQQCYWPTGSWHVLLVPEDRVTHNLFVPTHVPGSPRCHREPGLCFPDTAPKPVWPAPASSNRQVLLPSPWRAPLTCPGPTKRPAEGNNHNRCHTNCWWQPIPSDKLVVIIKNLQSCSLWEISLPTWGLEGVLRELLGKTRAWKWSSTEQHQLDYYWPKGEEKKRETKPKKPNQKKPAFAIFINNTNVTECFLLSVSPSFWGSVSSKNKPLDANITPHK